MVWSIILTGKVYSGINNIYQIKGEDTQIYECRIKGKILSLSKDRYNPLAPGDNVEFEPVSSAEGLITNRLPRKNRFARWNKKRASWQAFAANIHLIFIVMATGSPPPRPRFVDRALIAAQLGGVPAAILINKVDISHHWDKKGRIKAWESIGTDVYHSSALTGQGLNRIREISTGKTLAFFGASGVGKTSLINSLIPGSRLATGTISQKYNRGRHITNFGRLLDTPWGGQLIDTPGIREIVLHGIVQQELISYFPEFIQATQNCVFRPCSHLHEKECGVKKAIQRGNIHSDRYETYLRLSMEIRKETPHWA